MALTVGTLNVKFGVDLAELNSKLRTARAALQTYADDISKLGLRLSVGLTAPIVAFGVSAFRAAARLEQLTIAMSQFTGSEAAARRLVDQIRQIAAVTPFETEPLANAVRKLMAIGYTGKQALAIMMDIGDAVAAMGGGAFEIELLTKAISDITTAGRLYTQDVRQLLNLGIPAWQILADATGKSIDQIRDAVERGAISSNDALRILFAAIESRYGGMMRRQSQSAAGLLSTLVDTAKMLLTQIGEPLTRLFRTIAQSDLLQRVIAIVQRLVDALTNLPAPLQDAIIAVGTFLAVIGPILAYAGQLITVMSMLGTIAVRIGQPLLVITRLLSPLGMVITVLTIIAAKTGLLRLLWHGVVAVLSRAIALLRTVGHMIWDYLGRPLADLGKRIMTWIGNIFGLSSPAATSASRAADNAERQVRRMRTSITTLGRASTLINQSEANANQELAESIAKVIEQRRKEFDEWRRQQLARVGWTTAAGLWAAAMVAGVRTSIARATAAAAPAQVPSIAEIAAIKRELEQQTRQQQELIRIIRERLAYV
jgi:tape measure domain-containing protein